MARLVHNDYLEQASDSGLASALLFGFFVIGALVATYPPADAKVHFGIWLGLAGWALQGFVEFNLFVPALAWPAFLLLGWLLGQARVNE